MRRLITICLLAHVGCLGKFDPSTANGGSTTNPNGMVTTGNEFTCGNTVDTGPSQILRLSKTQYVNTLSDIFGAPVVMQLGTALGVLPDDNTLTNPAALSQVSPNHIAGYMTVAMALAQVVTTSPSLATTVFGSCAVASSPSAKCVDTYLTTTAPQIFRRPLTPAEIAQGEMLVSSGTGTYLQNLGVLLAYHLQTPWFSNRIELGTGTADAATTFGLTPFEVATRISFATTDSTPDAALFGAASTNELSTSAQIEAQVRRLFATGRGKAKIHSTIHNYIGNPNASDLTVLPPALLTGLQNPANLSTEMFTEMDQFIDYVVWEKNGSLTDLLTSQASFASDPDLASIYGNPPADPNRTSGAPTATFAGRRAGILMRLPLLASAGPRTNMVHRGVNYLRSVLCEAIPEPSAETMAAITALNPTAMQLEGMTNRQYLQTVTASGACKSCHSSINPAGFAFENFDPVGRLRTAEAVFTTNDQTGTFVADLPIDTTSEVLGGSNVDFQVTDGLDLVTQTAKSEPGIACFSRQVYRFLYQRSETTNDNCALNNMYSALTKTNGSILDAMVAGIANSATALHRKPQ